MTVMVDGSNGGGGADGATRRDRERALLSGAELPSHELYRAMVAVLFTVVASTASAMVVPVSCRSPSAAARGSVGGGFELRASAGSSHRPGRY